MKTWGTERSNDIKDTKQLSVYMVTTDQHIIVKVYELPVGPVFPFGPAGPLSPFTPYTPGTPINPCSPFTPARKTKHIKSELRLKLTALLSSYIQKTLQAWK